MKKIYSLLLIVLILLSFTKTGFAQETFPININRVGELYSLPDGTTFFYADIIGKTKKVGIYDAFPHRIGLHCKTKIICKVIPHTSAGMPISIRRTIIAVIIITPIAWKAIAGSKSTPAAVKAVGGGGGAGGGGGPPGGPGGGI